MTTYVNLQTLREIAPSNVPELQRLLVKDFERANSRLQQAVDAADRGAIKFQLDAIRQLLWNVEPPNATSEFIGTQLAVVDAGSVVFDHERVRDIVASAIRKVQG